MNGDYYPQGYLPQGLNNSGQLQLFWKILPNYIQAIQKWLPTAMNQTRFAQERGQDSFKKKIKKKMAPR